LKNIFQFNNAIGYRNKENCPNCTTLPNVTRLPDYQWVIESVCILFICITYILKIIVAPVKKEFALNPYSVNELLTVVVELVALAIRLANRRYKYQLTNIMLLFYTTRMLLIFNVTKQSKNYQVLTYTISNCFKDLLLVIAFFLMSGGVFTVIVLSAEFGNDLSITAFEAFWATIGIMTTMRISEYPSESSSLSLAVANLVTIIGLILLSLSIPVFVEEFGFNLRIYKEEQFLKRLKKEKEEKLRKKTIRTDETTFDTSLIGSIRRRKTFTRKFARTGASYQSTATVRSQGGRDNDVM